METSNARVLVPSGRIGQLWAAVFWVAIAAGLLALLMMQAGMSLDTVTADPVGAVKSFIGGTSVTH